MSTLAELRAKSDSHQAHLDRNTTFLTLKALAARWGCSTNTVRAIPATVLPWVNIGSGLVREARRYHPDDVMAYEMAQRTGQAA